MKYIQYFKKKWKIKSNIQFINILIVFAITGSLSLYVAKPILDFFGLAKGILNNWIYYPLRIITIFPIYQLLILIVAWFFGQFHFFWSFEKKILIRIGFKRFIKEN